MSKAINAVAANLMAAGTNSVQAAVWLEELTPGLKKQYFETQRHADLTKALEEHMRGAAVDVTGDTFVTDGRTKPEWAKPLLEKFGFKETSDGVWQHSDGSEMKMWKAPGKGASAGFFRFTLTTKK